MVQGPLSESQGSDALSLSPSTNNSLWLVLWAATRDVETHCCEGGCEGVEIMLLLVVVLLLLALLYGKPASIGSHYWKQAHKLPSNLIGGNIIVQCPSSQPFFLMILQPPNKNRYSINRRFC